MTQAYLPDRGSVVINKATVPVGSMPLHFLRDVVM